MLASAESAERIHCALYTVHIMMIRDGLIMAASPGLWSHETLVVPPGLLKHRGVSSCFLDKLPAYIAVPRFGPDFQKRFDGGR